MIGMALDSPSPRYTERHDGWKAMRPGRMHDTKPHESTADARKRKKAERQRKKEGRKGR